MVFNTVRNYFAERLERVTREWQLFQSTGQSQPDTLIEHQDSDLARIYRSLRYDFTHEEVRLQYEQEHNIIEALLNEKQEYSGFPSEFRLPLDLNHLPSNRVPPSGIIPLPWLYKSIQYVTTSSEIPESGFRIHPKILYLLNSCYPRYKYFVEKLCRPLGTTDATIKDFFKPQFPSKPVDPIRKERILSHIIKKLDITPCLPLHFIDTLFDRRPLSTGTGYHNRRDIKINAHAIFSHPKEYESKRTSKGYYINSFLESARTLVHRIKQFGVPFYQDINLPLNTDKLRDFFLDYPAMLFTRNHISDRDGHLKQRPVYAVDDLFLTLESMVTFPFHVIARKYSCCIMYGLETFRGANAHIDRLARSYQSFFTIDWSGFDQRLPRVITDIYWSDFLERFLVIDHGYQPTYEYPSYPDLTPEKMFRRLKNILWFLQTWYNNMVYISADGYSYARTSAGVPSGLLNTQYLDSFGNLFIIIDALIEFECSDTDIDDILLLIMGDDNSGFTHWPINRLEMFISFLETYALTRYGMILSKTKSVITIFRNRIETLSYQCNFGMPTRPISKLVAQLCYPEHGPIPKYMSARAIGIAYAACGQDDTFHNFCRDIYYQFLEDAAPQDPQNISIILKHLPGQFKLADSYTEQVSLEEFPTIRQVRDKVSKWQGPLAYAPKWNYAHFMYDPDHLPFCYQTMSEFRSEYSIPQIPIPTLFC